MAKRHTNNRPQDRIGKITPAERQAAEAEYADHLEACNAAGVIGEALPFDRFLLEWTEVNRVKRPDDDAGQVPSEPGRDYNRMFLGKKGYDRPWGKE